MHAKPKNRDTRDVDKFENRRKFCKNRRKGRRRHEQPQDARGGGRRFLIFKGINGAFWCI